MKPDWKDAPEWANWLAMDDDGSWYWFELEPDLDDSYWNPNYSGRFCLAAFSGPSWRSSLEKRP